MIIGILHGFLKTFTLLMVCSYLADVHKIPSTTSTNIYQGLPAVHADIQDTLKVGASCISNTSSSPKILFKKQIFRTTAKIVAILSYIVVYIQEMVYTK